MMDASHPAQLTHETPAPVLERVRQVFRYFNRFMLLMWRLGLGPHLNVWPAVFGRIMVLTHTGRKSGVQRRTPANYALVGEDLYCVAGFGRVSDWYRNLIARPDVQIWLPDGWWSGVAEDVSSHPQRLMLMREVLVASGFAAFAAGINPYKLSDAQLDALTADYRLVRIRLTQPHTGPGGPGELAWVWPWLVMALIPLCLGRRNRR